MSNTTNTAPAFMLTTNVAIVDENTGYAWVPTRVVFEDVDVLAYYTDGPAAECVRYGYNQAVRVIPVWELELFNAG